MEDDTKRMRKGKPYVFTNMRDGTGLKFVAQFIEKAGGLIRA